MTEPLTLVLPTSSFHKEGHWALGKSRKTGTLAARQGPSCDPGLSPLMLYSCKLTTFPGALASPYYLETNCIIRVLGGGVGTKDRGLCWRDTPHGSFLGTAVAWGSAHPHGSFIPRNAPFLEGHSPWKPLEVEPKSDWWNSLLTIVPMS